MATTTNFGWETPDDTDLVKDGALAMRTLGNAIDASLVDLKGGTTGQVLSKNSNTDMDFTWVTSDDANAIQNAIVDAKGDLITATAADTPARLAVGSNGDTLVADSAATTGLRWQPNFSAGKNKIINGDFGIWQRGTSFTINNSSAYTADRFWVSGADNMTISQQTFTPGTAPVAGYEGTYFLRFARSTTTNFDYLFQKIEDVRTLAGQTVTISFWAKASSGTPSVGISIGQNFGSGGSAAVEQDSQVTISTSWARYSKTYTLGSISGKTIGAGNHLYFFTYLTASGASQVDYWGVQVEAGSVATAFQTATGTLQGELAACQRYYYRTTTTQTNGTVATGYITSSTAVQAMAVLPVPLRVVPSSVDSSTLQVLDSANSTISVTAVTLSNTDSTTNNIVCTYTISGGTSGRFAFIRGAGSANAYVGFSAEL